MGGWQKTAEGTLSYSGRVSSPPNADLSMGAASHRYMMTAGSWAEVYMQGCERNLLWSIA